MRNTLIVAFALALGGCAAQVAISAPFDLERARGDVRDQHEELMGRESSVAAAIERAVCEEEDLCAAARQICELADQICTIADRHEGDRELTSRCADSRMRCERVTTRVAEACGC